MLYFLLQNCIKNFKLFYKNTEIKRLVDFFGKGSQRQTRNQYDQDQFITNPKQISLYGWCRLKIPAIPTERRLRHLAESKID